MATILDMTGKPYTPAAVTAAPQELTPEQLYADLSTPPPEDRRLEVQEIYGLKLTRHHPEFLGEGHHIDEMIEARYQMAREELAAAPPMLNRMIHTRVHHQLRARPDRQSGKMAIEQWVPALGYWLISGLYDMTESWEKIVSDLQEGDPRRKTPTQRLEETREAAKLQQARNEAAAADRIAGAIDELPRKNAETFLEVERAIKTGEKIVAHGDDLAFVEKAHEHTKKLAAQGDRESQAVLSGGIRDGVDCFNPTHNPTRR